MTLITLIHSLDTLNANRETKAATEEGGNNSEHEAAGEEDGGDESHESELACI